MGQPIEALAGTSSPAHLSGLDSDKFGIRVARTKASCSQLPAVVHWCRKFNVKLLIARVPLPGVPARNTLIRNGFAQMDTLEYWVCNLRNHRDTIPMHHHDVKLAHQNDADSVRSLARIAFHGYRGHYHCDPRLPDRLCDEVYADWAYRFCLSDSMHNATLVYEIDGKPVGFTMIRRTGNTDAEIVLSGTSPEFRGRGIYRTLHGQRGLWCIERGIDRLVGSANFCNEAMTHCYQREGFQRLFSINTFHKWFIKQGSECSFC